MLPSWEERLTLGAGKVITNNTRKNGSCGLAGDLHMGKWDQGEQNGPNHDVKQDSMLSELQGTPTAGIFFVQRIEYGRMDWEPEGRLPSTRELDHGRCGVACHTREFGFF